MLCCCWSFQKGELTCSTNDLAWIETLRHTLLWRKRDKYKYEIVFCTMQIHFAIYLLYLILVGNSYNTRSTFHFTGTKNICRPCGTDLLALMNKSRARRDNNKSPKSSSQQLFHWILPPMLQLVVTVKKKTRNQLTLSLQRLQMPAPVCFLLALYMILMTALVSY